MNTPLRTALLFGLAVYGCTSLTVGQTDDCDSPQSQDSISRALTSTPLNRWAPRYKTPAMIGDFYAGSLSFRGNGIQDSLIVLADDLDAPVVLPPAQSILSISEPGPVGIFSSSLSSVQELQAILRNGGPIPPGLLVGAINHNAVVSTQQTVSQIQAQLGSTNLPYDIIAIAPPPAPYSSQVGALFSSRNTLTGATEYNSGASGALLQGGVDTLNGGEDLDAYYFYDYVIRFNAALGDASNGGVGWNKIAENGTVLPQDRIFFRYGYMDAVRYSNLPRHLNRFTPGFEKSFLDGFFSVEVRAPFASDMSTSSILSENQFTNGSDAQFGNLSIYTKFLLRQTETLAFSSGLGVITPTANDTKVSQANGLDVLRIKNESVHLQPFIGSLLTPNDRWFIQSFLSADIDTSGNTVLLNHDGQGLSKAGILNDASVLFADIGAGFWLYQSPNTRGLTGIAPMLEVHQNTLLGSGDSVSKGPFMVDNLSGVNATTNLVIGTAFQFGQRSQLSTGYLCPVGGSGNQDFDGGFTFMFNQR